MLIQGNTADTIAPTRHVPLPGTRTIAHRDKPRGLDWSKHTAPAVDPDAIARLTRLGLLTVTQETIDDRPVNVVEKVKTRKRPGPRPTGHRPTFDIETAERLYRDGQSAKTIAPQVGVSWQTVIYHLKHRGVPIRGRAHPVTVDVDTILDLARQGHNRAEISRRTGHSWSTITGHLQHAGIEPSNGHQEGNGNRRHDIDTATLTAQYHAGATVPTLAAQYGTGTRTIRERLLKSGVQLRDDRATHSGGSRHLTQAEERGVVATYRRLGSAAGTARAHSISHNTVLRTLRRQGEPIRPSGQVQRGRPGNDGAASLKALLREHGATAHDVRTWARDNNLDVPNVGIPSRRLVDAYLNARPNPEGITA